MVSMIFMRFPVARFSYRARVQLGTTSYRIAELGTELRSKQEDYDKEIHRSRNELAKKEKE